MQHRLFALWISTILGLLLSRWPHSLLLYGLVFWIFIFDKGQWKGHILFLILGFARGGLFFLNLQEIEPDSEPHLYDIKIESSRRFFSLGRIVTRDLEPFSSSLFRLEGRYRIGETIIGVGEIKKYQNMFSKGVLTPSEELLAQDIQGKIKWLESPRFISLEPEYRQQLRAKIFRKIKSPLEPLNALRKALVLGDGSGLSRSVWQSFNITGLSHILVISGSHLSAITLMTWFLFHFIFGSLKLRLEFLKWACLTAVSLFFYVCNQEVSLVRSLLSFILIFLIGKFWPIVHRFRPSERLSMVGILILLVAPFEVFRPTYALSFGATWALLSSWNPSRWAQSLMVFFVIQPLCQTFGIFVHWLAPLFNFTFLPLFLFVVSPLSLISIVLDWLEPVTNSFSLFYFEAVKFASQLLGSSLQQPLKQPFAGIFLAAAISIFASQKLSHSQKWLFIGGVQFAGVMVRYF